MHLKALDRFGATVCWAEVQWGVYWWVVCTCRGQSLDYVLDLIQEDLGTRVQTGIDRVVERVFETFHFAYDTIQKVCDRYAGLFVDIDLYYGLDRV
ncbi:hypothetical protein PILCRDRAFT_825222 [Piloderma croceum F 1598]|uniref:Uncharacterized protein n=1 Tax=Piloderma croceum (strain F 1598) TaxID=765440 RepID=A0A0C3FCU6_PILCF|nr:hypothetical protein PILCRDRAFT_825222 [Piloderma croceum F 1598]